MFYIPQIREDDCGFAALKMLLANLYHDRNYLYLPQNERHGRYSYDDLQRIGFKYGLNLEGFKAIDKEVLTRVDRLPFIATIDIGGHSAHAVLVYRVTKLRVRYLDPRSGKRSCSFKSFLKMWDGTMLVPGTHETQACPYQEKNVLKSSERICFTLLQICTGIPALLGVYFIGVDVYVFIPIILFSLAAVFELFTKAYSLSLMKKIDTYFFENVHIKNKQYKQTLYRFERYKKSLLASPLSFLLSLVICFSLILIILQNDVKNYILIVTSFIASVVEALLYRPLIKKEVHRIAYLEDDLDSSKDDEMYKSQVARIHQKAYRIGLIEISKNCIGISLFIAIAIVLMAGKSIVSFPHVVFYFALQMALYHSFNKIVVYPDEFTAFRKAKVEFNNCLHQ